MVKQNRLKAVNGYLYNGYAALNANFLPTDWALPTLAQHDTLLAYLGGASVAGGKLKEIGTTHWTATNVGADNSSGYTAFASGYRNASTGAFAQFGLDAFYWNSHTAADKILKLSNWNTGIGYASKDSSLGYSVRAVYIGAGSPESVADYDGNIYDTIVIGTQRWTKQNWKCTKLNNGTDIPNVTINADWWPLTTLARCAYNNDETNV